MRMLIRGHHLRVDPSLRARAERRLQFALGRFGPLIDRVEVRLGDVNGPRGGVDKRCRVVVALRRAGEVVLTDGDRDLEALIDRAADRVGRAVGRRLRLERRLRTDREGTAWRGA